MIAQCSPTLRNLHFWKLQLFLHLIQKTFCPEKSRKKDMAIRTFWFLRKILPCTTGVIDIRQIKKNKFILKVIFFLEYNLFFGRFYTSLLTLMKWSDQYPCYSVSKCMGIFEKTNYFIISTFRTRVELLVGIVFIRSF